MKNNSYNQRQFNFYVITLVIMTALCYVIIFYNHHQQRKQASLDLFEDIYYELTSHLKNENHDIDTFLKTHIDRKNISYRLLILTPAGESYIHDYKRTDQNKFSFYTVPHWGDDDAKPYQYEVAYSQLLGRATLPNNYELYSQVAHKPLAVNLLNPLFWLPLLICFVLLCIGFYLTMSLERAWKYLIDYSHGLPQKLDEPYKPLENKHILDIQEVQRMANNLNRINQQLHHQYRFNQTLGKRLQRMVELAPLPIFLITRQGHISYFNKPFEQSFMTSFKEGVTYNLTDFVIGADSENQQIIDNISRLRIPRILDVVSLEDNTAFLLHLRPWIGKQGQVRGFNALLSNKEIIDNHLLSKNNHSDGANKHLAS